jgi:hypothetical protein
LALRAVTAILAVAALFLSVSPWVRAADAGTGLTQTLLPSGFGSIAVDSANSHVFVSSPTSGTITVLDFSGDMVGTIDAAGGSMVVFDGSLYVALPNAIDVFSTSTFALTATLASGQLVDPSSLVESGGELWTTTGDCAQDASELVSVSPENGTVQSWPMPADSFMDSCIGLEASPWASELLAYTVNTSPATLTEMLISPEGAPDIAAGPVTEDGVANLRQVAFDSDGSLVMAAGSPYYFAEINDLSLALNSVTYPASAYPVSVATSAADGGLIAGATSTAANTVYVYQVGQPGTALLTTSLGTFEPDYGGLAFSPDGTLMFAVVESSSNDTYLDVIPTSLGTSGTTTGTTGGTPDTTGTTTSSGGTTTTTSGSGVTVPAATAVEGIDAFGIGPRQLNLPQGVAFDSKGDLFVADSENDRVLEYTPESSTSYSPVGTAVGGTGQLSDPSGIALDTNGDLFVADTGGNNVVEYAYNASTGAYAPSGTVVAGTGAAGLEDTQLDDPIGVAVDAKGDLFVTAPGNNSVDEFTYDSTTATYSSVGTDVAGNGTSGSAANQLVAPHGIVLDADGDLFVVDTGNDRVMEYPFNSATGTYATSGTEIAGSLPSGADFLSFEAAGDLFVSYGSASGGGVLEFAYNSATASYASSGTAVGNGANVVSASGLAFSPGGDLFVAEGSNGTTQTVWDLVLELAYNSATGQFAPLGTIMGQDGLTNTGISAIALDSQGNLFISDPLSTDGGAAGVFEFPFNSAAGDYSVAGALISGTGGSALAFDRNNDLFVAQSSGVLEFPWDSTTGSYPSSGSAVPGATQLSGMAVTAMAFDAKNDLFVGSGNQVLEFVYNSAAATWAASGTAVATVSPGTLPSGYTSFIQGVAGIVLDANGDLFVSNPSASQVLEYAYSSGTGAYATTGSVVAGTGGTGNGSDELYEPTALAVDKSGDLFAYDAGNDRVLEFTKVEGNVGYGAGSTLVFSDATGTNPANGGIAVNATGDLFVGNDLTSAVVYETPTLTCCTVITGSTTSTSTTTTTVAPTTTTTTHPTTTTTHATTTTTVAPTTTTTHATTTTTVAPTTTTTHATTTTTHATTTTTTVAPTTTTVAPTTTTVTSSNLIPDPGFETSAVPADYWGSTLAHTTAVVHSGSGALAQTTTSTSGGWDLDDNSSWYAPISSAYTYSSAIWVRATAAVSVDIGVDLLTSNGTYVDTASGPWVTLAANTWTELTVSGIKPTSTEVYAGMEPDFQKALKGTVIYWDDMALTG